MSTTRSTQLRRTIYISIFSSIAFLLMLISFPLPGIAPFLKLDFSEIPVLIITFLFGPLAGITTELLKNVLHYLVTSSATGVPIDQFANFAAGLLFVLPFYYFLNRSKERNVRSIFITGLKSTVVLAIGMCILNYFILLPAYTYFLNFPKLTGSDLQAYITLSIIPFNIIKGIAVTAIFTLLYPRMKRLLLQAK